MDRSSILANFPGIAAARLPQDVYVFFDDFLGAQFSSTTDAAIWNQTLIATQATTAAILDGTNEAMDEAGGILNLVTDATADEGNNLQVNGEAFGLEAGYPLYFETRINVGDISNVDMFIGLSHTDAEIVTTGLNDGVGFLLEAGVLYAHAAKDSTEKSVDCAITEADDDWIRLAFEYDGADTVRFYVAPSDTNEFTLKTTMLLSTVAHYLPDNEMLTPTIEAITGATATAEKMYVDYVYCAQLRYSE